MQTHMRLQCPVAGCPAADSTRHPGWASFAGLRPHIDCHLLGSIPGSPPQEWMDQGRWNACRICGKLVSRTCANGVHRRCWGEQVSQQQGIHSGARAPTRAPDADLLPELPTIREVCLKECLTREWLEPGLLKLAQPEFVRLVVNVVQYNDKEAWKSVGMAEDTLRRMQARVAWTELFMFSKACLPALPGGKTKAKRNLNLIHTRLERWAAGERRSLWDDLPTRSGRSRKTVDPETAKARKQLAAVADAQHGMPGRAVKRLTSRGLAPDTPELERMMRSKFIRRPLGQAESSRPPSPPENELIGGVVIEAINSFPKGASAGPSGLRSDWMKQYLNESGDDVFLIAMTRLVNLLANADAPDELRPFLGGAVCHAIPKDAKIELGSDASGQVDARPACGGDFWRRLTSKCLLSSDMEALRTH